MPTLKSFFPPHEVVFQIDLVDGPGYVFNPTKSDYLNWIPVEAQLNLISENLNFLSRPTLSVEGVKSFLSQLESVIRERKKVGETTGIEFPYQQYEYVATEGEFSISLKNTSDGYEKNIVIVEVWFNMAYCILEGQGVEKGVRFRASFDELETFYTDLCIQFTKMVRHGDG